MLRVTVIHAPMSWPKLMGLDPSEIDRQFTDPLVKHQALICWIAPCCIIETHGQIKCGAQNITRLSLQFCGGIHALKCVAYNRDIPKTERKFCTVNGWSTERNGRWWSNSWRKYQSFCTPDGAQHNFMGLKIKPSAQNTGRRQTPLLRRRRNVWCWWLIWPKLGIHLFVSAICLLPSTCLHSIKDHIRIRLNFLSVEHYCCRSFLLLITVCLRQRTVKCAHSHIIMLFYAL